MTQSPAGDLGNLELCYRDARSAGIATAGAHVSSLQLDEHIPCQKIDEQNSALEQDSMVMSEETRNISAAPENNIEASLKQLGKCWTISLSEILQKISREKYSI